MGVAVSVSFGRVGPQPEGWESQDMKLRRMAPEGFSIQDCAGAFQAYVAKTPDGTTFLQYVGKNDHPRHKAAIEKRVRDFLPD